MNLPLRNQFQSYIALAACLSSIFFVFLQPVSPVLAQAAPGPGAVVSPDVPARTWIDAAAANEFSIVNDDGKFPLRYRVHKVDSKEDITREVIETRNGTVARLVERNGQKLTAAEDAAERQRLKDILASPGDFIKHHKRDDSTRKYCLQLIKEMPGAMIFSYAPGQPQPPGAAERQIVIDFHPDTNYKTSETVDNLLTGIEGRLWIDARSRRLTRAEARVIHPVNFGWGGVLAKIRDHGTIEFEQANAGGDRWVYSHVEENLSMLALWVKNIPLNDRMTATDFRMLPGPISVQDAVHTLLAIPVPLR